MEIRLGLLTWASCFVALGFGCSSSTDAQTGTETRLGEGIDLPSAANKQDVYGAAPSRAEQQSGSKADQLNLRGTVPEVYGMTEPPPAGSRSLAEWESADGLVISWVPYQQDFLLELTRAALQSVDTYVVTANIDESQALLARFEEPQRTKIHTLEYEHESVWTRDYGPGTIRLPDGRMGFVDWMYYSARLRDDALPTLLATHLGVPVYRPALFEEGGNFMTNGQGLCVMTNRIVEANPVLGEGGVRDVMTNYFGCSQIVILQRMESEGTGHVDMFSKFTQADTVLVGKYDPADAPANAALLDQHADTLSQITLPDGQPLRVVRIPMPKPQSGSHGLVFGSFTNSLIVNQSLIMPTYGFAQDLEEEAVEAYRQALPEGTAIHRVDSTSIIQIGGAVHCTTMAFSLQAP